MLSQLSINNFTIIDQLNINFNPGMTVLTGETGAGKSIIIDTLELVLGGRADSTVIRPNTERCTISAIFDLQHNSMAEEWLKKHELNSDNECILQRIINSDGRSRSTINNTPCTQQMMRNFAAQLVNIHGQHEHQGLLKANTQRELLDNFAKHNNLLAKIKNTYHDLQLANKELVALQQLTTDHSAHSELLQYQIHELEELNLQPNEIENLHQEYQTLVNAEDLISGCNSALELITANNLHNAHNQLQKLNNSALNSTIELINNAIINSEEAADELQHYLQKTNLDPERLQQVEDRLNKIHDIARKHHVKVEELSPYQQQLQEKLQTINNAALKSKELQQKITQLTAAYKKAAQQLTNSRKKAAQKLEQLISAQMQLLNMPHATFKVAFNTTDFSSNGVDQIEFLVSTNPGNPAQLLAKIVSGGELSRISLAIQVITAEQYSTPVLIFDEVDVGIGGKTAHIVGNLLRTLAHNTQVLCVTHLPQVAAQGEHHFKVQKETSATTTTTQIKALNSTEKVHEIARMLGGTKITKQTLAHAQEMCDNLVHEKIN